MHCRPPGRGFTLVEVVMAMTILSFVFAGAMIVLTSGFQMLDNARHATLAGQILQSEMEILRCMKWEDIAALPETEDIAIDTPFPKYTDDFTCTRSISPVRDGLVCVTFTVTWKSHHGALHKRTLFTYIADGGLNDYFRG